jgi:hypothetical protein
LPRIVFFLFLFFYKTNVTAKYFHKMAACLVENFIFLPKNFGEKIF